MIQAWRDHAACKGADTAVFFPQRGEDTSAAKAMCDGCPVRTDCLEWALGFAPNDLPGIYAGTSGRERRRIQQQRARAATATTQAIRQSDRADLLARIEQRAAQRRQQGAA